MANIHNNADNAKPHFQDWLLHGTEYMIDTKGNDHTMHEGLRVDNFALLPAEVQQAFRSAHQRDKVSQSLIAINWGYHDTERNFRQYMHCLFGGNDGRPDYNPRKGRVTPDINTHCYNFDCPLYGKLCLTPFNIKGYEMETVILIAQHSANDVAKLMYVGKRAIDERLKKLHAITNSRNTTEMCVKVLGMINYKR